MTVVEPRLTFERRLLRDHAMILACDEVGRGALAGPVAVGVVAIDARRARRRIPEGLRDSKLVPAARRAEVAARVDAWVQAGTVGWASSAEIDEIGLMRALGTAALRAIATLRDAAVCVDDAVLLLDGDYDYITTTGDPGVRVITRVKGDRDCASVAAASVIAKVARDRLMVTLDAEHPAYDWVHNKGYASPAHRAAIRLHGLSPQHRASWDIADAPTLF